MPSKKNIIKSSMINAPVAKDMKVRKAKPKTSTSSNGIVTVSNREFISDVEGTTPFTMGVDSFINPGFAPTFPWLSAIALRYEKFRFKKLVFQYAPTCSTTTPGTVCLAVDPDSSDSPPSTKQRMLTYGMSERSSAWDSCFLDCKQLCGLPWLYTLAGGINPAGTDIKTYTAGTVYLATQNIGSVIAGELYVDYIVEFMTPNYDVPTALYGEFYATGADTSPVETFVPSSDANNLKVTRTNDTTVRVFAPGSFIVSIAMPLPDTATLTLANLLVVQSDGSSVFATVLDGAVYGGRASQNFLNISYYVESLGETLLALALSGSLILGTSRWYISTHRKGNTIAP